MLDPTTITLAIIAIVLFGLFVYVKVRPGLTEQEQERLRAAMLDLQQVGQFYEMGEEAAAAVLAEKVRAATAPLPGSTARQVNHTATLLLGFCLVAQGRHREALTYLDEAEQAGRGMRTRWWQLELLIAKAFALSATGDHVNGAAYTTRAVTVARAGLPVGRVMAEMSAHSDAEAHLSRVLSRHVWTLLELDDLDGALAAADEALALAQRAAGESVLTVSRAADARATILLYLGRPEEATEAAQMAIDNGDQAPPAYSLVRGTPRFRLAEARFRLGRHEAALALLRDGIAIVSADRAESPSQQRYIAVAQLLCAHALIRLNRPEEAATALAEYESRCTEPPDEDDVAYLALIGAELVGVRGDLDAARLAADDAVARYEKLAERLPRYYATDLADARAVRLALQVS